MEIHKGDIYKISFKGKKGSHLQQGIRPAIVTSNNKKNRGVIINVTPLTTVNKRSDLKTHIVIKGFGLTRESIALIEQTVPIDRKCILEENYIGSVNDAELMEKITYENQKQFA